MARKGLSFLQNCSRNRCLSAASISFVILVFAASCFHLGAFTTTSTIVCHGDANERAELSHGEIFADRNNEEPTKLRILELKQKIDKLEKKIEQSVTFLPLIDKRYESQPLEGTTWFMSSFRKEFEDQNGLMYFPSKATNGRILCVRGRNQTDGTENGYALAWRDHLPSDSILLPGLTFISEEYYTFENIWHSFDALGSFLLWIKRHQPAKPDRFVLYRKGELTYKTTSWTSTVLLSAIGYEVPIERLDHAAGDLPFCFDRSVVNRHGLSRFSLETKTEVIDIVRRSARRFCNVTKSQGLQTFNFTLLTRTGKRSFKDESAVESIFKNECIKFPGCRFRNIKIDGLSYCDQVLVMTTTQVLATVHGAQLTNIVFMEKGSHVMEMYPKGWLEFAGPGQYLYRWLSNWSELKHEGDWRDTEGPDCPNPEKGWLECFFFHKDRQVGYNETALSKWAAEVIRKVEVPKLGVSSN